MRTEEEKTHDLVLYEKKASARDIRDRYVKINKRVRLIGILCVALGAVLLWGSFWKAFDSENILGMVLILAGLFLGYFVVKAIVAAAVMKSHNPAAFLKWGNLCSKWEYAHKNMQKLEGKFADQTAFEEDIQKAEKKLLSLSEELMAFAEKQGIEYRTEF